MKGERIENLVRQTYKPTRYEYFVGQALQGLVTGRSEKDLKHSVRQAITLAKEMEEALGPS